MINENKLIIKQINKFGKVPQIYELLQMIERLEQENKQLKEKLDCDLQWALKYEKQVDNWNMLKEHLKNRYDNGTESISYRQVFMEIREAMQVLEIAQELEKGDSNEYRNNK